MATEKMMTFEEWDNETFVRNIAKFDESERRKCFESARLGTIPAENAVVIPDVSEWPEWCDGVAWYFYHQPGMATTEQSGKVYFIPRPKPVWVPRVGEAVFALDNLEPRGVWVAKIMATCGPEKVYVICNDGDESSWKISDLKPFHESHIGKPWSEIPGEPS